MKNNNLDIEKLALDLLDFCGGAEPTNKDLRNWLKVRRHDFDDRTCDLVMQTAESFLVNP